jgi:hypothetical protein
MFSKHNFQNHEVNLSIYDYSPSLSLGRFFYLLQSRQDSFHWGSACRKAATCTQDSTKTEDTHTQISMIRIGFKPTTPAFKRAKTLHSLNGAVTVIGRKYIPIKKEEQKYIFNPFLAFAPYDDERDLFAIRF